MGSHLSNTWNTSSTEVGSHLSSGMQRSLACDWDLVNLSSDFKKPEHSERENLLATELSDLIDLIQSRNNGRLGLGLEDKGVRAFGQFEHIYSIHPV